jgi:hypothetical protein
MKTIEFPWGAADTQAIIATASGASQSFTAVNNSTILTATALGENTVLNITASSYLRPGAELFLVVTVGSATCSITFTGDIVAPVITGVNLKTVSQGFKYNGTKFHPTGAKIQND